MLGALTFGDESLYVFEDASAGFHGSRFAIRPPGSGWALAGTALDSDEISCSFRSGELRWDVRHSVGSDWSLRATLANEGPERLEIDGIELDLEAGPGQGVWLFAGGASGFLLIHEQDGPGPLLLLDARAAGITDVDDRILLSPARLNLAPGGRFTASLRARTLEAWPEPGAVLPAWLPRLTLAPGEPLEFTLPDAAVETPADVRIVEDEAATRIEGEGSARLTVHAGTQTHYLDVCWSPGLGAAIRAAVAKALRPHVPVNPAVALLLQRALAMGLVDEPDRAHDLLDRNLETLVSSARPSGEWWRVLLWTGELVRTGERGALASASAALTDVSAAAGSGVACLRAYWDLLAAGVDPEPAAIALRRLSKSSSSDWLAQAEGRLLSGTPEEPDRPSVTAIERALGSGLPGRPLGVSEERLALIVAVAGLIAEGERGSFGDQTADRLLCGEPRPQTLVNLLLRPE